jgi:hypothetical protein
VRTAYTSSKVYLHGCDRTFQLYALYSSDLNDKWSKMYTGLHVKYPLFLYDFNETWIFLTDFRKSQVSNFVKIRTAGVELFHADGRTDMKKLVVALRNFPNAPNKALFISHKLAFYRYMFISILRACTQLHLFRRCGEELNGMTDSKDRTYFQLNEVSNRQTDRQQDLLWITVTLKWHVHFGMCKVFKREGEIFEKLTEYWRRFAINVTWRMSE